METSISKLRLVDCRPFFEAVVEKSNEMGVGVCSAVVNSEGHLIALERTDDAGFILPEFAIAKAFKPMPTPEMHRMSSELGPKNKVAIDTYFRTHIDA